MEYWRLLAHNHWFTLNILGYRLRLCVRCTGYFLGFTIPIYLSSRFVFPLGFQNPRVLQLVYVLFALPFALDWISQSWGFRHSSNPIRLATGILLGLDIFIFSRHGWGIQDGWSIFVATALLVAFVGYIGKFKSPSGST